MHSNVTDSSETEHGDPGEFEIGTQQTTLIHTASSSSFPSSPTSTQATPQHTPIATLDPSVDIANFSRESKAVKLEMDTSDDSSGSRNSTAELTEMISEPIVVTTDYVWNTSENSQPKTSPPLFPDDGEFGLLPKISIASTIPNPTATDIVPGRDPTTAAVPGSESTTTPRVTTTEAAPNPAKDRPVHKRRVPKEDLEESFTKALHGSRNLTILRQPISLGNRIVGLPATDRHGGEINANQSNFSDEQVPLVLHGVIEPQTDVRTSDQTKAPLGTNGKSLQSPTTTEAPNSTTVPPQDSSGNADVTKSSTDSGAGMSPKPSLKPIFLAADVKLVLDEVNRDLTPNRKSKHVMKAMNERKIIRAPKSSTEQDSRNSERPETTVSPEIEDSSESEGREESEEDDDADERIVYDAHMKPRIEKIEGKRTGREGKSSKIARPSELDDDSAAFKYGGRKSQKTTKEKRPTQKVKPETSDEDEEDEEIAEVFKTLRANDHNSCIQRAICEYEALKWTTQLTPMQESFVDLFG